MLLLLSWCLMGCQSPSPSHGNTTDVTETEGGWASIIDTLRAGVAGADVREGGMRWMDSESCLEHIAEYGRCYGNNPDGIHGMVEFPEDGPPRAMVRFQLSADEVVLYVGLTPPESRYYSFNSYQMDKAWPDGHTTEIIGSIAPSLHLLDLCTSEGCGSRFDKFTVVVFAMTAAAAERANELLTPMLVDAGVEPGAINVQQWAYLDAADAELYRADAEYDPESVVELTPGYGDDRDTYEIFLRVAAATQRDHAFFDADYPDAAVFKVAFEDPPPYEPFVYPHLPPDGDNGDAEGVALRAARDAVVAGLERQLTDRGLQTDTSLFSNPSPVSGFGCINEPLRCGGNCDDARYLRSEKFFELPEPSEEAAIYVVGIDHTSAGVALPGAPQVVYSNLSAKNWTNGVGVASFLDTAHPGTAAHYFPDGVDGVAPADLALVYVQRFGRSCPDGGPCVLLPEGELGLELEHSAQLVERVYLNRNTGTAPGDESIWGPVAVAAGTDLRYDPQTSVVTVR